jgi:hypothetical protein
MSTSANAHKDREFVVDVVGDDESSSRQPSGGTNAHTDRINGASDRANNDQCYDPVECNNRAEGSGRHRSSSSSSSSSRRSQCPSPLVQSQDIANLDVLPFPWFQPRKSELHPICFFDSILELVAREELAEVTKATNL